MNIQNRFLRSVHVWDVQEGTRVFLFPTYPLFTLGTGMNLQSALRVCNFEHPELVSGNNYKNPLNIWGVTKSWFEIYQSEDFSMEQP